MIIDILPNQGNSVVLIQCPVDGKQHVVYVDGGEHTEKVTAYIDKKTSAFIQDFLPFLNEVEREQILSGLCPDCQSMVFKEKEEEEKEDYGKVENPVENWEIR